jgi:hypothetical protein
MDFQISDTLVAVVFLAIWITIIGLGGSILYYKLMYDKWIWNELRLPEQKKKIVS